MNWNLNSTLVALLGLLLTTIFGIMFAQINQMDQRIDQRFEKMDQRLDKIENSLVDLKMSAVRGEERIAYLEKRFKIHPLEGIEMKLFSFDPHEEVIPFSFPYCPGFR